MARAWGTGSADAEARVRAPVEAALSRIVLWATLACALSVTTIVAPVLLHLDETPTLLVRHIVPAFLALSIVVHLGRSIRRRNSPPASPAAPGDPLEAAWGVDPPDTALAIVLMATGSVATLAALVVLALPYLAEPADRTIVVTLCLPGGGALAFLAGLAWAAEIQAMLQGGLTEARQRFRAYWAELPRRPA